MEQLYFVYTVMHGHTFVICDQNGKFKVKSKPSDNEVSKWQLEVAKHIAETNSKNGIIYKIKPVP